MVLEWVGVRIEARFPAEEYFLYAKCHIKDVEPAAQKMIDKVEAIFEEPLGVI